MKSMNEEIKKVNGAQELDDDMLDGVVGGLVARTLTKYKLSVCILEAQNDAGVEILGGQRDGPVVIGCIFRSAERLVIEA